MGGIRDCLAETGFHLCFVARWFSSPAPANGASKLTGWYRLPTAALSLAGLYSATRSGCRLQRGLSSRVAGEAATRVRRRRPGLLDEMPSKNAEIQFKSGSKMQKISILGPRGKMSYHGPKNIVLDLGHLFGTRPT